MESMKALVKEGRSVSVQRVPRPVLERDDEVIIRVVMAGICRTDLYVAEGRMASIDPLILGHEFSGVVSEVGAAVSGLAPGDRVTAMPVIPCGSCEWCREDRQTSCQSTTMLGIDHHGVFAEYVAAPAAVVHRLPDSVSYRAGAYTEPIAASLAVLKAGLHPGEKGLIYGDNRIALLTKKILEARGFADVSIHAERGEDRDPLSAGSYDFIIETVATSEALREMIRAVRPFGKIVLKSRQLQAVAIDFSAAIRKELTFHAVNYGSFAESIAMVADGRLDVEDVMGEVHRLDDFGPAFSEAGIYGCSKSFFAPGDDEGPAVG